MSEGNNAHVRQVLVSGQQARHFRRCCGSSIDPVSEEVSEFFDPVVFDSSLGSVNCDRLASTGHG